MSSTDLALVLAAFVAGLGVASLAWWIWSSFSSSEPIGPKAPSDPPAPSAPPRRPNGYLRTSQRVLLHLSRQPRLAFGDLAPPEVTQAGMSRSLGVSQPALARVLRRLLDGEAILEMRTHVRGGSQRLKVYQLTVHGEAIARDLRGRAGRAPRATAAPGAVASETPALSEPLEP